ncbi:MAG: hypothetical protein HPY74_09390 [Firmicutes bacterium]|nr:hypothetical protein [Bacillota bacterium]
MVKKKWLLVTLIVVVVILVVLAIGIGTVLSIHNSTYDCSFVYVPTDDLLNEIAKKHTYYDASTRTVEVELNQDLINSLIKDNFESLDIALPEKFAIKEILFNTKDQRLYINGKYGSINVPLSVKINVNITEEGIEISASDLKLGQRKAPNMISKQIPQDALKYSIKYEDFDLPRIFNVKDVYFGSGILKVFVQLNPDKIKDMAMEYRNNLLGEINNFKGSQSEIISNFITRFLDTTNLLSDAKVEEYVDFVLDSEELVNSAIHFALADDLSKYAKQFEIIQKAVADWAAPLEVVKYYGSIEETVEKILYDEKLRELVAWFLPEEQIDEYVATAEEYYGMYEEYYGMYEELLDTMDELESVFGSISFTSVDDIDSAVATLQNQIFRNRKLINILSQFIPESTFTDISDTIDEYVALYHEYMDMLEDTKDSIAKAASEVDVDSINEFTKLAMEYAEQADDVRQLIIDVVEEIDTQLIKDLVHFLEFGSQFGQEFIATIHPDNYSIFREYIDNLNDIKVATLDSLKEADTSIFVNNAKTVKEWGDFTTEVVTMLKNKDIENAIDVLMNKDFSEFQFEIPDFEELGWEIELEM